MPPLLLALPIDVKKSRFYFCCSNLICNGCLYANIKSNKHDRDKAGSCPFCREPASSGNEESNKRKMKRIKANDPVALRQLGMEHHQKGDYGGAFEYLTKSAELGNIDAHYNIGVMYHKGKGMEKDMKKAVYHWEKAAIGGHPQARHNLAVIEEANGNIERAVKHYIIAANLGYEDSMKELWGHYSLGNITKEDLDTTLRAHQAAVDATKSEQREIGEAALARI